MGFVEKSNFVSCHPQRQVGVEYCDVIIGCDPRGNGMRMESGFIFSRYGRSTSSCVGGRGIQFGRWWFHVFRRPVPANGYSSPSWGDCVRRTGVSQRVECDFMMMWHVRIRLRLSCVSQYSKRGNARELVPWRTMHADPCAMAF